MVKILAPNKEYNGISATVKFIDGVGETNSPHLIDWFKRKGYEVKEIESEKSIDDMTGAELKELAKEKGLEGYSNMKVAELKEALKELEEE
ncbi:hypothetical protein J2S74_002305 [Evansella vedderi]|uniref:Rho termination factor N-terminal domain-containing protein n=1 Tax=Evansella vedderi TaxID=38282 RepID=A0ABT9ZUK9_9BACI|nr:hypothetical protein [Evansella vedderi]MDQ0254923.1 hypothetical protein [Evansella vedderi]